MKAGPAATARNSPRKRETAPPNEAAAAGPASGDALYPLAVRAADAGNYRRVTELFVTASRRGEIAAEEAARWRRLLVEAGDFVRATELAPEPDGEDEPTDRAPSGDECREEFIEFDPGAREPEPTPVPPPMVNAFCRWFAGRGDLYARQWYDARRDRSGYWPVRRRLSRSVVEQHLLGRITVGQYVLHTDCTVSFAAIDFDPTSEALEQARLGNGPEGGLGVPSLSEFARRVRRLAGDAGAASSLEDTGGDGLHLWLFFAPRLPAARARALLRELLWRAGAQPPAVSVEIFPKQERLTGKGLGNLIKLPFGVHQATARRSHFLDGELKPLDDAEALAAIGPCDPAAVERLLQSRVVTLPSAPQGGRRKAAAPPAPPAGPSPRALAEALAAVAPGRDSAAAADRVLKGCALLRELARHAHEERTLTAGEARALLYTVGLVSRENDRIDAMFANAGVSRKEIDRVHRGLQSPAGCKKLSERFPGLCRGCAAPAPPPGGYATPALFALREVPRLSRRPLPGATVPEIVEGEAPQSVLSGIEQRLERIEARLEMFLPAAPARVGDKEPANPEPEK